MVFSGFSGLEFIEPYASHPPLAFFGKPLNEDALRQAIEVYRRSREEPS